MLNVLIVGFGGMGCRHAQSFLNRNEVRVVVVEPNRSIFRQNVVRIGAEETSFDWFPTLEDVNFPIDFAVVATSAEPRFSIMERLLASGVSCFLLEKVVFQSEKQFAEIINQLERSGARAYCNFVNRYYPQYRDLKALCVKEGPLQMHVTGSGFGLGCNGLHYIDLFEYLTGSQSTRYFSSLKEDMRGNKRGPQYKEVVGNLVCESLKGDLFSISCNSSECVNVQIRVTLGKYLVSIDEVHSEFNWFDLNLGQKAVSQFQAIPSSVLTYQIFSDIMQNTCLLPTVQDTYNAHASFFSELNTAFYNQSRQEVVCPIT